MLFRHWLRSFCGSPSLFGHRSRRRQIGTRNLSTHGNFSAVAEQLEDRTLLSAIPSAPDLFASHDTGDSNSDNITKWTTPAFIGTATPDSTIELYADGLAVGSTTTNVNGHYVVSSSTLGDGTYSITTKADDGDGSGFSDASIALSLTIDTTGLPAPSVPDLAAASDSGNADDDNITSDTTPILTGTAEAGSTVTLSSDADGAVGTTTTDGSGNWSIETTTLSEGIHSLTAATSGTDTAGNTGAASAALTITVDTTAPAAPYTPDLWAGSDSGTADNDDITSDESLVIVGTTAEADSTVDHSSDVNGFVGTTTADGSGNWNVTTTYLTEGVHSLTATSTDTAGNTSAASTALVAT
ncbi:Ig-like domain-containing protein, partial [Planctomycetaceae bacterium]|nr:Ig-like domain-containing protein [Planctomycetaceae bacterium]